MDTFKKFKNTYQKLNQDLSKSKYAPEVYYDAQNVRITSKTRQSTGSINNIKGDEFHFTLPDISTQNILTNGDIEYKYLDSDGTTVIYTTDYLVPGGFPLPPPLTQHRIIGYAIIRETVVLFVTTPTAVGFPSVDTIWSFDMHTKNYVLEYMNELDFSVDHPIEAVGHYENPLIQKVYWVDGNNELRHANIKDPDLPYESVGNINVTPTVDYDALVLTDIIRNQGLFNSGKVQYAYNYANKYGAVSAISPRTPMYNINQSFTGNLEDEEISMSFQLTIPNLDTEFAYVNVYRIFYSQPEAEPIVELFLEEPITANMTSITFIDDGTEFISAFTALELTLLGTPPFIPYTLAVKDNRLFTANHIYKQFEVDSIDFRAYRFSTGRSATLWEDDLTNPIVITATDWDTVPADFDAYNASTRAETDSNGIPGMFVGDPYYNAFCYQEDGVTIGAEGPNVVVSLVEKKLAVQIPKSSENPLYRYPDENGGSFLNPQKMVDVGFKRDEIYRIGLEFRNDRGQWSFVQWLCDFRMPTTAGVGGVQFPLIDPVTGEYNQLQLKVELKGAAILALDALGCKGWRIVRVHRTSIDKTIVAQGILAPTLKDTAGVHSSLTRQPPPILGFFGHQVGSNKKFQYPFHYQNGFSDKAIEEYDTDDAYYDNAFIEFRSTDLDLSIDPFGYFIVHTAAKFDARTEENLITDTPGLIQSYGFGLDTIWNSAPVGGGSSSHYRNDVICLTTEVFQDGVVRLAPIDDANTLLFDRLDNETGVIQSLSGSTSIANQYAYNIEAGKHMHGICNYAIMTKVGSGVSKLTDQLSNIVWTYPTNTGSTVRYHLITDYKQSRPNQYGGFSFADRSRNQYIPSSDYADLNTPIEAWGDTFVSLSKYQRSQYKFPDGFVDATKSFVRDVYIFPCENYVNEDLRIAANIEGSWNANSSPTTTGELKSRYQTTIELFHEYNPIYNYPDKLTTAYSKPFDYILNNVFDSETRYSELKILGERLDAWTDFNDGNSSNVNGIYGAIVRLVENNDVVYYFQEFACGYWNINPNVQTVGNDGTTVLLGTGQVLQESKSISTNNGTQHKWSIIKSQFGIMFYDQMHNVINMITDKIQPISNNSISVWLNNIPTLGDNPLKFDGVSGGFYADYNETYMTFVTDGLKQTWMYNHDFQAWVSTMSTYPQIYIQPFDYLFNVHYSNTGIRDYLWKFDRGNYTSFQNTPYESYVTVAMNGAPDIVKLLNNLQWNSEAYILGAEQSLITITHIRIWNDYQDTGKVVLDADNHNRLLRDWRFTTPILNGLDRLRSQYFYISLYIDATDNREVIIHDLVSSTILQS